MGLTRQLCPNNTQEASSCTADTVTVDVSHDGIFTVSNSKVSGLLFTELLPLSMQPRLHARHLVITCVVD